MEFSTFSRRLMKHLSARFRKPGPSGFGWSSTADQVCSGLDLTGQTYVVTGANSGIGVETVRALVLQGAHVFAACRTLKKAEQVRDGFGDLVLPVACELSDLSSVRACVESIKASGRKLDGIIANAGIFALPERELVHGNHIGHFALVTALLDQLADAGRVVMVSSSGHRLAPPSGIELDRLDGDGWYTPWMAYGHTKLANLLFAKELARRFKDTRRVAIAVHPGLVYTNLQRNMRIAWLAMIVMSLGRLLFVKSARKGAATQVYAAVHPDAINLNGEFLDDCNVSQPTDHARDPHLAERLWEVSEQIVAGLL